MERNDHIRFLFDKYLANRISEEELKELLQYFNLDEDKSILGELISLEIRRESVQDYEEELIESIDTDLQRKIFAKTRPVSKLRKLLPAISIAAMLLLGLSFVGIMFVMRAKKADNVQLVQERSDVKPGGDIATLTLADGSKVKLDDAKAGTIAQQAGVIITKKANGQIIYTVGGKIDNSQLNTIETPNGGEYQVSLPDGTKVWLNAASSLKYPVAFTGLKDRKVELTGQAYFEVAHNKTQPFKVLTNGQIVEVLGTHFDIMAYSNEGNMTTTLLQGSVRVNYKNLESIIKPGEAAVVGSDIQVKPVDLEQAVAWKNGRTYFKDADIPTMMRALSRWYNIEVIYQGEIPKREFTGGISRKSNLSSLLKILKSSNIHTTLQGRKLIIRP